jgi:Protein of unknown function (DUF2997)
MARTIEVLISPQGETIIQTHCYAGSDCLEASRWLENALGQVIALEKTAEFFQTEKANLQIER